MAKKSDPPKPITYFPTAETIWANARLTAIQKIVALCILQHRSEDTWAAYPSIERIMLRASLKRSAVFDALAALKQERVVWWYRGDKRMKKANEYHFDVDQPRVHARDDGQNVDGFDAAYPF